MATSLAREPVQRWARAAGVLLLLSVVCGGFGEAFVPMRILVRGDAAATAAHLQQSGLLFRLGFVAYLVEATCDIVLALAFYVLLRPVHPRLALLAAFFGLVSTAIFAVSELFLYSAVLFVGSPDFLSPFSPAQQGSLLLLVLRLYGLGAGLFLALYGIATILRGWLIARSGFLPRVLGVLLVVGGLGFVCKNLLLVLAPRWSSDLLLLPMFVAILSLTVWMLVRGVDVARWHERAADSGAE